MKAALYLLYIINCFFLILVVLLQAGKGDGLAGLGGGGGSAAVFGARGASTLLQKLTVGSAGAFMTLSIVLAIITSGTGIAESGSYDTEEPAVSAPVEGSSGGGAATTPPPPAAEQTPPAAEAEIPAEPTPAAPAAEAPAVPTPAAPPAEAPAEGAPEEGGGE